MLLSTNSTTVTNPVLVIEVEGIRYRTLIETGEEISYASSSLIKEINKKTVPQRVKENESLYEFSCQEDRGGP